MLHLVISGLGLVAAVASGLGCAVLWAWLTTLPAGRLALLSALVLLGVGGFWLGG